MRGFVLICTCLVILAAAGFFVYMPHQAAPPAGIPGRQSNFSGAAFSTGSTAVGQAAAQDDALAVCRRMKTKLLREECLNQLAGSLSNDTERGLLRCMGRKNVVSMDECFNGLDVANWSAASADEGADSLTLSPRLAACGRLNPLKRDKCFESVAKSEGIESVCDRIGDADVKWRCYALTLRDSTLCAKVTNRIMRDACMRDLSKEGDAGCTAPLKPSDDI